MIIDFAGAYFTIGFVLGMITASLAAQNPFLMRDMDWNTGHLVSTVFTIMMIWPLVFVQMWLDDDDPRWKR